MPIEGAGPIVIHWPEPVRAPQASPGAPTANGGRDFASALASELGETRAGEQQAEQMSRRFAAGDPTVGIHEVMIAAEKASISLRYAVTLKNKLIEAYRELMNTPV